MKKVANKKETRSKSGKPVKKTGQGGSSTEQTSKVTPAKFILNDHIPPLLIGGGSLFLELEHTLTRNPVDGDMPRPQRYSDPDITGKRYGPICLVRVYTEFEKEIVGVPYEFDPPVQAQLRLWIQEVPNPDNEGVFDQIPEGSQAQLLIKGGPPLVVEIENSAGGADTLLDREKTHKKKRLRKHRHRGRGNRHFRIGKWQITDGNTPIPGLEGSLDSSQKDGYIFFVSFSNPGPF